MWKFLNLGKEITGALSISFYCLFGVETIEIDHTRRACVFLLRHCAANVLQALCYPHMSLLIMPCVPANLFVQCFFNIFLLPIQHLNGKLRRRNKFVSRQGPSWGTNATLCSAPSSAWSKRSCDHIFRLPKHQGTSNTAGLVVHEILKLSITLYIGFMKVNFSLCLCHYVFLIGLRRIWIAFLSTTGSWKANLRVDADLIQKLAEAGAACWTRRCGGNPSWAISRTFTQGAWWLCRVKECNIAIQVPNLPKRPFWGFCQ